MAVAGRVRWTVLTDVEAALRLVDRAAADAGFRTERGEAEEVRVHVPRSLLHRRKAARFSGSASVSARGTEISWVTDSAGTADFEGLHNVEEKIPDGLLYYHGLQEAAGRAGLSLGGKRELRTVVSALDRNETVRAVGRGLLDDRAVFVILTDTRLLVLEKSPIRPDALLDAAHRSIKKLSLGKRTAGETLRLELQEGGCVISGLGHGEGYGIATSFREAVAEGERTPGTPR